MLTPDFLRSKFEAGLPYDRYIATGTPEQRSTWTARSSQIALTPQQRDFLGSLERRINVLVSSGMWCGDCWQQVPMLARIAEAAAPSGQDSPGIDLRLVDRDAHADLAEKIRICGGLRVPTVLFLNEDLDLLAIRGDQTLSRLRAKAAKAIGAACELPGAATGQDETAATIQDWVNDVETAYWLARLSPKLRQRHGD